MKSLGVAANVAVVLACMAMLVSIASDRLFRSRRTPPAVEAKKLVGRKPEELGRLPTGSKGSVVAFVSKQCHYCSESMSYYQSLMSSKLEMNCDVKFVVAAPEDKESPADLEFYLKGHHLVPDAAGVVPFDRVGILVTPTLVIRDPANTIRHVWVESLSEVPQMEVRLALRSPCGLPSS